MLLKTFVSILEAHDANIMSSLTVQDLIKFLCVAANVVVRSEKSLQLTTHQRPIRFLAASLLLLLSSPERLPVGGGGRAPLLTA
jgi:hypothetical protein